MEWNPNVIGPVTVFLKQEYKIEHVYCDVSLKLLPVGGDLGRNEISGLLGVFNSWNVRF